MPERRIPAERCPECDGAGYFVSIEMEHDYRCDGSCSRGLCPVPAQVQDACPTCAGVGYVVPEAALADAKAEITAEVSEAVRTIIVEAVPVYADAAIVGESVGLPAAVAVVRELIAYAKTARAEGVREGLRQGLTQAADIADEEDDYIVIRRRLDRLALEKS